MNSVLEQNCANMVNVMLSRQMSSQFFAESTKKHMEFMNFAEVIELEFVVVHIGSGCQ